MSARSMQAKRAGEAALAPAPRRAARLNIGGLILTLVTVVAAMIWAFPLYWAVITSLQARERGRAAGHRAAAATRSFSTAYVHALFNTSIGRWYLNSIVTSVADHRPRRPHGGELRLRHLAAPLPRPPAALSWMILASFMVPIQALIVNHFVLMANFGLVNTWLGVSCRS